jgi:[ribosomal protein S5]-alanine N-acetyltransferase
MQVDTLLDDVVIRDIKLSDAANILIIRSHPIVNKFINRKPCNTILDAEDWITAQIQNGQEGVGLMWVITTKSENTFMGTICLWNFKPGDIVAELGFDLLPDFYGKGIMDQAIQQVLLLNKTRFSTIEAFTDNDNIYSRNLLERNGFELLPDRKDVDVERNVVYAISFS